MEAFALRIERPQPGSGHLGPRSPNPGVNSLNETTGQISQLIDYAPICLVRNQQHYKEDRTRHLRQVQIVQQIRVRKATAGTSPSLRLVIIQSLGRIMGIFAIGMNTDGGCRRNYLKD